MAARDAGTKPLILQIVPEPPAAVGGVRAYAQALHGLDPETFGPPAHGTDDRDAATEPSSDPFILLHYSNYGFDPAGKPYWLAAAVERWRRERCFVVVYFHEVFATSPPWRRAFWSTSAQRSIARRVARGARRGVTSLGIYSTMLHRLAPELPIELLPPLSTVGEVETPSPLASREPNLVVFGSEGLRSRAYRRFGDLMRTACGALGLSKVLDIGPLSDTIRHAARMAGVPVQHQGILTDSEVSAVLRTSQAGFLAYPAEFLGKSTVYAAYAAHGVLPIFAWDSARTASSAGPPCAPASLLGSANAQAIASAAHHWYSAHGGARHLAAYRRIFGPACAS